MKHKIMWTLLLASILSLSLLLTGCLSDPPTAQPPADDGGDATAEATAAATATVEPRMAKLVQTGSGVTVKSASDWASEHPDIHASYLKNGSNSENVSYVEEHPQIKVLYEGMGFSKDYNSARGHVFAVDDVSATLRPHALANCFTCKTPDFTAAVNELGDAAYSIPFEEMLSRINEPISCYNCHANEPGELYVTHTYLSDAMGSDIGEIDAASLTCGQCHVEYHFDPVTKAVTLPYDSISSMNPEAILNYYNNLIVDGEPFADYVNPRSGVRQIKAQHPEFETYYGEGSVHAKNFNCADCHMYIAENGSGESYVNHEWTSPLDNQKLITESCSTCHNDLVADVKAIQEPVKARTEEIGLELERLTEKLVIAAESEDYTEDELNNIRSVFRDAQFYWDFIFVENSYGAHNSTLTGKCLDKSEELIKELQELLA